MPTALQSSTGTATASPQTQKALPAQAGLDPDTRPLDADSQAHRHTCPRCRHSPAHLLRPRLGRCAFFRACVPTASRRSKIAEALLEIVAGCSKLLYDSKGSHTRRRSGARAKCANQQHLRVTCHNVPWLCLANCIDSWRGIAASCASDRRTIQLARSRSGLKAAYRSPRDRRGHQYQLLALAS